MATASKQIPVSVTSADSQLFEHPLHMHPQIKLFESSSSIKLFDQALRLSSLTQLVTNTSNITINRTNLEGYLCCRMIDSWVTGACCSVRFSVRLLRATLRAISPCDSCGCSAPKHSPCDSLLRSPYVLCLCCLRKQSCKLEGGCKFLYFTTVCQELADESGGDVAGTIS